MEERYASGEVTIPNDDAIDGYIDASLERISKIVSLLVEAEEAYSLSKGCKSYYVAGGNWREKRDNLRVEGTALLYEAGELFSKQGN